MIRLNERPRRAELNMTPMIDMVFLLIVFFLAATTFSEKEREQDVLLPANRNPGGLSRAIESNVVVNVHRDGRISVAGKTVAAADLAAFIRERKERTSAQLKVQIRADKRAIYGGVAQALEAVESAGIVKPYVVARSVELEN